MLLGIFYLTNFINKNINDMQNKELHFKDVSHNLITSISMFHKDVLTYSILNTNENKFTKDDINNYDKKINNYFNKLESTILSSNTENKDNSLIILKKLKIRYNSYINIVRCLKTDFKEDYEDGIDSLIGLNLISNKMFEELDIFVTLADKKFKKRIENLNNTISEVVDLFITISIISLILFIFFGGILKNSIIESLTNLKNGLNNFFDFLSHKKDIVDDIKIIYHDELGEIAQHINENLHEVESLIKNERKFKESLQIEVEKQTKELRELSDEIISTQKDVVSRMGAISETRSKETGNHVKRVAEYSKLFAKKYGLSDDDCELLYSASPMHDIGKVGIPDNILNKPGKHTPEEFEIMKTHAKLGYEMLKSSPRAILKSAAIISYEHHEKWDGTGYPNKKANTDIHIFGRITAIADVFDALGSDRCYKKAWELDRIIQLLKDERGKHFEPKLVDIFLDNLDEFIEIRDRYKEILK